MKDCDQSDPDYSKLIEEYGALELLLSEPEPETPRLLVDDATPESLTRFLPRHGYRAACLTDEATFLELALGRYSGTPNLNLCLNAWGGKGGSIDRKGAETIELPEAFVTLGLCIQPAPLKELAANKAALGKGFVPRFLACLPVGKIGTRQVVQEPIPQDVKDAWGALVGRLLNTTARTLKLSLDARQYVTSVEEELEPRWGGDLSSIKAWGSKAVPGQLLRLAAVLHCASGAENDVVALETVKAARTLIDYFLQHACYIADVSREDWGLDGAKKVLHQIKKLQLTSFIYTKMQSEIWEFHSMLAKKFLTMLTVDWYSPTSSGPKRPCK